MGSFTDRTVIFSAFQKSIYGAKGRDVCPWCKQRIYESQLVRIKNNGSRHTVYHEKCYCQKVIEL